MFNIVQDECITVKTNCNVIPAAAQQLNELETMVKMYTTNCSSLQSEHKMQNSCTACLPGWTQLLYAAKTFSQLPRNNPCLNSTFTHVLINHSYTADVLQQLHCIHLQSKYTNNTIAQIFHVHLGRLVAAGLPLLCGMNLVSVIIIPVQMTCLSSSGPSCLKPRR